MVIAARIERFSFREQVNQIPVSVRGFCNTTAMKVMLLVIGLLCISIGTNRIFSTTNVYESCVVIGCGIIAILLAVRNNGIVAQALNSIKGSQSEKVTYRASTTLSLINEDKKVESSLKVLETPHIDLGEEPTKVSSNIDLLFAQKNYPKILLPSFDTSHSFSPENLRSQATKSTRESLWYGEFKNGEPFYLVNFACKLKVTKKAIDFCYALFWQNLKDKKWHINIHSYLSKPNCVPTISSGYVESLQQDEVAMFQRLISNERVSFGENHILNRACLMLSSTATKKPNN